MTSDTETQSEVNNELKDGITEELSSKLLMEQCIVSDDEKPSQTQTNTGK